MTQCPFVKGETHVIWLRYFAKTVAKFPLAILEKIILEECTQTSLVLFVWDKSLVLCTPFQAIAAVMFLIYQCLTMKLKT